MDCFAVMITVFVKPVVTPNFLLLHILHEDNPLDRNM